MIGLNRMGLPRPSKYAKKRSISGKEAMKIALIKISMKSSMMRTPKNSTSKSKSCKEKSKKKEEG